MNNALIAAVILVGAAVLSSFGYTVLPEEQATLGTAALAIGGGVTAIVGVFRAVRDRATPPAPPEA